MARGNRMGLLLRSPALRTPTRSRPPPPRALADTAYGTGDHASDVRLTASMDHLAELDGRDSFDRKVNRFCRGQTEERVPVRGARRAARYGRREGESAASLRRSRDQRRLGN